MQLCSTAANLHSFRPIAVAFQLCLIEHKLLRRIHPPDMLTHAPPHRPNAAVQATTDFFNYFTRTVECSILESATPGDRSKVILRWIKVANHLRGFHNYQTLKAVVCALNTPPISRLKRTWPIVKRKPEWNELAEHRTLLSEQSNYYAYREHIKEHQTRPMIPFLGVLIHDLTYLSTIAKRDGVDPSTDRHVQEILKHLRYCSSGPRYSYEMLADADAAMQTSKKSLPFRKRLGGGLSEQGVEELSSLRDLSDEDIGIFIAHWLLTRKWISEKELDELSLLREP
ncbi:ras guanine nucleotide exchange factor domain-containing protein, partial [Zopfochytrium polystomum]